MSTEKIKLELNSCYITKGGYIVKILPEKCNNGIHATLDTSPGVSIFEKTAKLAYAPINAQRSKDKVGWRYQSDGSIIGLQKEWAEKLTIVEKYNVPAHNISGYKWLGGYPQFIDDDTCVDKDYFETLITRTNPDGSHRYLYAAKDTYDTQEPEPIVLQGGKLYETAAGYIVEIHKHPCYNGVFASSVETSPGITVSGKSITGFHKYGWTYNINGCPSDSLNNEWKGKLKIIKEFNHPMPIPFKDEMFAGGFPQLQTFDEKPEQYKMCTIYPDGRGIFRVLKPNTLTNTNMYTSASNVDYKYPMSLSSRLTIGRTRDVNCTPTLASTKTISNLIKRATKYWLIDPTKEVVTKAVRSVRYIVLAGVISGGVYAYNSPESTIKFFKSLIPKISIESPEILS